MSTSGFRDRPSTGGDAQHVAARRMASTWAAATTAVCMCLCGTPTRTAAQAAVDYTYAYTETAGCCRTSDMTTGIFDKFEGVTKSSCMEQCMQSNTCLSLEHNAQNQLCELHLAATPNVATTGVCNFFACYVKLVAAQEPVPSATTTTTTTAAAPMTAAADTLTIAIVATKAAAIDVSATATPATDAPISATAMPSVAQPHQPHGLSTGKSAVWGDLQQWHRMSVDVGGPATSEGAATNPFKDYRFQATFRLQGMHVQ